MTTFHRGDLVEYNGDHRAVSEAAEPQPGEALTGRVITPAKPLSATDALDVIQEWLRDPEWGVGMLEDIAQVVAQTGRTTESYPDQRPTWNRH